MSRQLLFTISILFLGCGSSEKDHIEIREVFQNFKTSLISNDYIKVYSKLDKASQGFYHNLLDDAIYADKKKLEKRNLYRRFLVLQIRHTTDPLKLVQLQVSDIFKQAFDSDESIKNKFNSLKLGHVMIVNRKGKGRLHNDKKDLNAYLIFKKEKDIWKIDFLNVLNELNNELEGIVEKSKKSETEFLSLMLQSYNGKKPGNNLWKPLLSRVH